jgi:hypothetical protein
MKEREASEVKTDPARSIGRAAGFGFFLILLLVGSRCGAQTAQPGATLVKVFPNCEFGPQRIPLGGILGELCKPVWKKVEADNGEVTWIDMHSVSPTLPRQVYVYTFTDDAKLQKAKLMCQRSVELGPAAQDVFNRIQTLLDLLHQIGIP